MNKNDIEKINEYKGIIASNNTRIANLNNSIAEIDNYFEKLHSVNSNSKRQIQNAYCKVYGYDSLYSNKIKTQVSAINGCKRKIVSLTNALG